MFGKRKQLDSSEYKEIVNLIAILQNRIDIMDTNLKSMRGLINRKVGRENLGTEDETGLAQEIKDLKVMFGGIGPSPVMDDGT